jgi:hypothetical protein
MFEHLKNFEIIVITGPQRSGTHICGKMVSNDTGIKWFGERPPRMDTRKLIAGEESRLIRDDLPYVWTAPRICRWCHIIGQEPGVAVIFMHRNINDIIKSQERIGWKSNEIQLSLYNDVGYFEGNSCEAKYDYFEKYQKDKIPNLFEVEYESLNSHKLWIDKSLRVNFHKKQTTLQG